MSSQQFDLSGVPDTHVYEDGGDDAIDRLWDKATSQRDHASCRDYCDEKSMWAPFRVPQSKMLDAIAEMLRGDQTSFKFSVYDATTTWALHFCREERIERWEWTGPYQACESSVDDAFAFWVQDNGLRMFWWDGERLHEVPRKATESRPKLTVVNGGENGHGRAGKEDGA